MQSPSVIISHSKCCCILECSLDAIVCLTDSGFGFRYTICICEQGDVRGRARPWAQVVAWNFPGNIGINFHLEKKAFTHWLHYVFSTWTLIFIASIFLKLLIIFGIWGLRIYGDVCQLFLYFLMYVSYGRCLWPPYTGTSLSKCWWHMHFQSADMGVNKTSWINTSQ